MLERPNIWRDEHAMRDTIIFIASLFSPSSVRSAKVLQNCFKCIDAVPPGGILVLAWAAIEADMAR